MTDINKINPGIDTSFSTKLNANLATSLRQTGLTQVQQLQDRAITFSADGGTFAEAYIDADGRNNSVDTGNTTASYDSIRDAYLPGGATLTATTETNTGGTLDSADINIDMTAVVDGIFTSITSNDLSVGNIIITDANGNVLANKGNGTDTVTLTLADYTRYIVAGETVTITASSPNTENHPMTTFSGSLFSHGNGPGVSSITFTQATPETTQIITHTIPTGTFGSTLSSAFATFKAEDWESGADVQYKLTNATEDTGWLNSNEPVSFTALTAEPDDLIVKLIPKTTSPTAGYPSINGVALYGDRP